MSKRNLIWKCKACDFPLGQIDEQGEILRIKYKDLYLWITGGSVTMVCRRCGTLNQLTQKDPNITEEKGGE